MHHCGFDAHSGGPLLSHRASCAALGAAFRRAGGRWRHPYVDRRLGVDRSGRRGAVLPLPPLRAAAGSAAAPAAGTKGKCGSVKIVFDLCAIKKEWAAKGIANTDFVRD